VCACAARITDALTAEARMLALVEWYLLSFHAGRQVTDISLISFHFTVSVMLFIKQ